MNGSRSGTLWYGELAVDGMESCGPGGPRPPRRVATTVSQPAVIAKQDRETIQHDAALVRLLVLNGLGSLFIFAMLLLADAVRAGQNLVWLVRGQGHPADLFHRDRDRGFILRAEKNLRPSSRLAPRRKLN